MNPGQMRTTIQVYDRGAVKDGQTGFANSDRRLICTLRAEKSDASTREIWEAYAAKTRNVSNFTVRPREGIRSGMWLQCDGQWYEIIAVQRFGPVPGRMILKAKLEEAV